jgi:hypothetical protein
MSNINSKLLTDIVATVSGEDEVHGSWTEEVGFVIARELATVIESGDIDHFYIKRDGKDSKYRIVKISENS